MKYDCVLIPGGGLLEDGSLPDWTIARLEQALALQENTQWIITLSGGTTHKPLPVDQEGYPVFESRQAAEFLLGSGADPGKILSETSSYDSIGNAYFARTLFTDPMSLARCRIITSEFHLPRIEAIFRWVFSLLPVLVEYELGFAGAPDIGLSPTALNARRAREENSLENLAGKIQDIRTLADFRRWLYSEHAAYAVKGHKEQLSGDELASY